jgi:ABC-type sugar transport system ATPase subunit
LRRGELLGIVGLVGSGRTETVTALFGGYSVYSAKISLGGKEVAIRDEADAIRLGMNMLTEDRKENGLLLLNDIKFNIVISNLKKILGRVFTSRRKEAEYADKYMKKLRIKAASSSTMAVNLSGGNQQKVVLAKALHSDPKILLLDEPTKGIDVGSKQEIYEIMNELLTDGISIVMISSELPEMLGMCDRFIVMANGRMVGEVDKSDATQETLMAACFS